MKKIVKLSLILVMLVCIMGSVYAAPNCSISLETTKAQYNKNDEFTVDVNMSKIESERGIMSVGATLEYDKDSLTLVKMEGQNNWETPVDGYSYNSANGKLIITKSGFAKNNETILKITFKVKEQAKPNLIITLKNITIADGTVPVEVNSASKSITIKGEIINPTPDPVPDPNPTPNPNPGNNNTIKNPDTNTQNTVTADAIPSGNLPKTGDESPKLIMAITAAVVIVAVCFARYKVVNRY